MHIKPCFLTLGHMYAVLLSQKVIPVLSVSYRPFPVPFLLTIPCPLSCHPVFKPSPVHQCLNPVSTSIYTSSRSISSSGRRFPKVLVKFMPVLRHSACCCHRAKRTVYVMYFSHGCLGFPLLLFPATIPCIIVISKPFCRVTRPKHLSS